MFNIGVHRSRSACPFMRCYHHGSLHYTIFLSASCDCRITPAPYQVFTPSIATPSCCLAHCTFLSCGRLEKIRYVFCRTVSPLPCTCRAAHLPDKRTASASQPRNNANARCCKRSTPLLVRSRDFISTRSSCSTITKTFHCSLLKIRPTRPLHLAPSVLNVEMTS